MTKNILIIHYNTPTFTECLVRSVNRYVKDAKIYIFDNSDKLPFVAEFENVTIFDNTKGQIIDFDKWLERFPYRTNTSAGKNNYASAKHCYSVHKCVELIDEPFVLLDSDVLLKQDISFLFSDSDIFIGTTELWKAKVTSKNHVSKAKLRAVPYLSFINTELCKKHGVKYFNESCIYGLSANGDSYDTGTYFFEQITKKKLKWTKINISNYIVHYKAGSWVDKAKKFDGYKQISGSKWLENNKKYWFSEKVIKNKNVVYTCITGGYDTLTEPEFVSDGFDYVCFTDNVDLNSDVWEIRPLPKETDSLSQVKKQRYVKLNPHLLLSDYDISIWVDGNVKIKGDLNTFMKEYLNDECSVYVPKHPIRDCIYKEEKVVLNMKKDKPENTNPQMKRYREEGFPENYGLLQSNIMLRRHNDEACIKLMEKWFDELKNGSHRDQLSFNYALWKNEDVKVTYMDKNIYKSSFFKWNGAHSKVKRATQSAPLPKKKPLKVKKREHKFKKGAKIKATMNISIYAQ